MFTIFEDNTKSLYELYCDTEDSEEKLRCVSLWKKSKEAFHKMINRFLIMISNKTLKKEVSLKDKIINNIIYSEVNLKCRKFHIGFINNNEPELLTLGINPIYR
tara:strand:- start:10265 stop:10576 length:312 start_codon:yes stop_codon:yes gene_type:complete